MKRYITVCTLMMILLLLIIGITCGWQAAGSAALYSIGIAVIFSLMAAAAVFLDKITSKTKRHL